VVTALAKSGEVLESLGRDQEALARYQKIVDMGGDPSWVHSAQKRMDLIRARLAPAPGSESPTAAAGKPAAKAKPAVKAKPKAPKTKPKPKPAGGKP
jgi:hypothetical protein